MARQTIYVINIALHFDDKAVY